MARRAPGGNHLATTFPEDCPSGSRRDTLPCASLLTGLLGTTTSLPEAGDLVNDALQHGKPQREDDGFGAVQRIAVAGNGDRGQADLCSQRSCRLSVGAGEPQGLAA